MDYIPRQGKIPPVNFIFTYNAAMDHQSSITFHGIDSYTPQQVFLTAKYTRSFAYHTVRERLPVILTTIVDQLVRNKEDITKGKEEVEFDLKNCIGKISKLKNEVQTNKNFINLCSVADDVDKWNKQIEFQRGNLNSNCWFESPWLFAECYMYRRLREIFENSNTLKDLDYFKYHKTESFIKSLPEIKALAKFTNEIVANINVRPEENFTLLMKFSLWANRCDLSLSAGSQVSVSHHYSNYVKSLDNFLLHDDSIAVYKLLTNFSPKPVVLDFVMDNAGFELFCDFCFCDFMCALSFVSKVRFHVKKFPWYVSDATVSDVKWLLEKMKENGMQILANRWDRYFAESVWVIHDENFWTLPIVYEEMKTEDTALYNTLSQSHLVVFKGDLNYRKLLSDVNWNYSESFDIVLSKFRPTNILSLRTIKSDIVCGLKLEKYQHLPADLYWMRTGDYATIQLYCKE